ncbi:LytR/AlgR family response regulator transcription factor [Spirosoma arcticum]
MAITCIVLDDEEMAIQHLLKYIAKVPYLEVKSYFSDPFQAVTYLQNNSVDLVFLDIEMPNFAIDGMDFVHIVGDKQGYIFTTAYPGYALKSYEYNAIDFLHKPYSFERFLKAVQKAKLMLQTEEAVDSFTYVRVEGKFHRIDFDTICWIESDRNYISIFTEQDRINLRLSIGEMEGQLPKKLFVRVHKSFIVSKKKIDLVEAHQLWVQRQNQSRPFPIGESHKKSLLEAIAQNSIRKK